MLNPLKWSVYSPRFFCFFFEGKAVSSSSSVDFRFLDILFEFNQNHWLACMNSFLFENLSGPLTHAGNIPITKKINRLSSITKITAIDRYLSKSQKIHIKFYTRPSININTGKHHTTKVAELQPNFAIFRGCGFDNSGILPRFSQNSETNSATFAVSRGSRPRSSRCSGDRGRDLRGILGVATAIAVKSLPHNRLVWS